MKSEWIAANRANWNDRATIHAARDGTGYQVQQFIDDRSLLSDVVRFDLSVLGDISGKNAVHLQCHIGTDTISWPASVPRSPDSISRKNPSARRGRWLPRPATP